MYPTHLTYITYNKTKFIQYDVQIVEMYTYALHFIIVISTSCFYNKINIE